MVKRYKETENISLIAKEFCTTRQTVRKWIKRFSGAIGSLKNCSKAPKNPYRRMDQRTEELLVQFRKEHPSLGYDYIHHYLLLEGMQRDSFQKQRLCDMEEIGSASQTLQKT